MVIRLRNLGTSVHSSLQYNTRQAIICCFLNAGADPELLIGGGANPQGGAPTQYFNNIF